MYSGGQREWDLFCFGQFQVRCGKRDTCLYFGKTTKFGTISISLLLSLSVLQGVENLLVNRLLEHLPLRNLPMLLLLYDGNIRWILA